MTASLQQPADRRIEAPARAIVFMVAGGLLLTLNDASVKWLSQGLPVQQIILLRGLTVLLVVVAVIRFRREIGSFNSQARLGQATRAALMVVSTFLFLTGLRFLPLADAIALAFIGPLLTTALAGPLLGEQVGWRRWSAVAVGFIGMLIMLRPSAAGLNWAAFFPIGAAFCGAFRDIVTRRISAKDSSLTTLFYSTLGISLAAIAVTPVLGVVAPSVTDLVVMLLAGCLLSAAHFMHIETFRLAEAATVVPFKYVSLLWGVLIGYLVWGDLPDTGTLAGAALIVGGGLYALHRERVRARQKASEA